MMYGMTFVFMGISLVLALLLLVIFISGKKQLRKKELENEELTQALEELQQKIAQQNRKTFRLDILEENCEFEVLEMEEDDAGDLKDKPMTGKIKDISITGLRLSCTHDLPVRKHIAVRIDFTLKEEDFSLKGKLVRKDEHQDSSTVMYGVQFVEMRHKDEERLLAVQRNIEIERHKKSIDYTA
jgi:c-di-GMP-binding flagellar brake protein YcgR